MAADDTLSSLLNDPQKMQQILQLASGLMGNAPTNVPPASAAPPTMPAAVQPVSSTPSGDGEFLSRAMPVLNTIMQSGKRPADPNRMQLLRAMKPFVSASAGSHIDHAARLLSAARMARTAAVQFLPHDNEKTEV